MAFKILLGTILAMLAIAGFIRMKWEDDELKWKDQEDTPEDEDSEDDK